MDEDWRSAEREDSPEDFRRLLGRAPTAFLAGVEHRLKQRLANVQAKLAFLERIVPRCKCGEISDGDCGACEAKSIKYQEMLRYWKHHGAFSQWLMGSQDLAEDAARLVKAYVATRPRLSRRCQFPECPGDEGYYRCDTHRWLHVIPVMHDRSKSRGR